MKGNDKVIDELNARLAEELAAINQYMVHAEMAENWGYGKLDKMIEKRAIVEMKHAEKLIARILYLDGRPIVTNLTKITIGSDVPKMHQNDLASEVTAVKGYNESMAIADKMNDRGTRELLANILVDEEEHVDELEAQLDQIDQMGVQNYLSEQTE